MICCIKYQTFFFFFFFFFLCVCVGGGGGGGGWRRGYADKKNVPKMTSAEMFTQFVNRELTHSRGAII